MVSVSGVCFSLIVKYDERNQFNTYIRGLRLIYCGHQKRKHSITSETSNSLNDNIFSGEIFTSVQIVHGDLWCEAYIKPLEEHSALPAVGVNVL